MKNLLLTIFLLLFIIDIYAQSGHTEKGVASYYHKKFHGRKTACGEIFDYNSFTAAHKKLPFQTMVKVTNLSNNKSVIVRINDRGPYAKGKTIDLSGAAAKELGMMQSGIAKVKIEVIDKESKEENTDVAENSSFSSDLTIQSLAKLSSGNIYDLAGKIVKPTGYGIQVNSFIDPKNVVNEYDILQSKTDDQILTEVAKSKRKKVYRVILGPYESHAIAKKASTKLKRKGIKGIIKKF